MTGFGIVVGDGTTYPYVWIAWAEQRHGQVFMPRCRILRRFGKSAALSDLAMNGPHEDTQLLPVATEVIPRPLARFIVGDPRKWESQLPLPSEAHFTKIRDLWLLAIDQSLDA